MKEFIITLLSNVLIVAILAMSVFFGVMCIQGFQKHDAWLVVGYGVAFFMILPFALAIIKTTLSFCARALERKALECEAEESKK